MYQGNDSSKRNKDQFSEEYLRLLTQETSTHHQRVTPDSRDLLVRPLLSHQDTCLSVPAEQKELKLCTITVMLNGHFNTILNLILRECLVPKLSPQPTDKNLNIRILCQDSTFQLQLFKISEDIAHDRKCKQLSSQQIYNGYNA